MRTVPRLVGFRLHTLAVKASEGVQRLAEGVEAEAAARGIRGSACGCSGELRVKAPSCDGAMLIGPLRFSSVLQADAAPCPHRLPASVLSVVAPCRS